MFKDKKGKKLGIGLGGGGAKGAVELGVLRAFEEEGIRFDVVAGTSIGSIIGALYAKGLSSREIEGIIMNSALSDAKNMLMARLTGTGVDGIISMAVGDIDFEDLKLPYAAVAVDMETGEEVDFTSGSLVKAMGASSAIPPYFHAVEYNGKKYLDGAFRNIVPCDVARKLGADFVIGVDLSMNRQSTAEGKKTLDGLYPENKVPVCNPSATGYAACDIMIAPDMKGYTSVSVTSMTEMYELGYFEAREKMPYIKDSLKKAKVRYF